MKKKLPRLDCKKGQPAMAMRGIWRHARSGDRGSRLAHGCKNTDHFSAGFCFVLDISLIYKMIKEIVKKLL